MNIHDWSQNIGIVEISDAEAAQITGGSSGDELLLDTAIQQSQVAGQHLQNTISLSEQLGSTQDPMAFTQLNAELQSTTQNFKVAQESLTTSIKSIGEELSTTARKQ